MTNCYIVVTVIVYNLYLHVKNLLFAICCSLICHVNLGFKNSDETKTLEEAVVEKTATRTDWMIEIINLFTAPILNQKFIDK